jgi:hypothetical protein
MGKKGFCATGDIPTEGPCERIMTPSGNPFPDDLLVMNWFDGLSARGGISKKMSGIRESSLRSWVDDLQY